jgi:hypothetical protein
MEGVTHDSTIGFKLTKMLTFGKAHQRNRKLLFDNGRGNTQDPTPGLRSNNKIK